MRSLAQNPRLRHPDAAPCCSLEYVQYFEVGPAVAGLRKIRPHEWRKVKFPGSRPIWCRPQTLQMSGPSLAHTGRTKDLLLDWGVKFPPPPPSLAGIKGEVSWSFPSSSLNSYSMQIAIRFDRRPQRKKKRSPTLLFSERPSSQKDTQDLNYLSSDPSLFSQTMSTTTTGGGGRGGGSASSPLFAPPFSPPLPRRGVKTLFLLPPFLPILFALAQLRRRNIHQICILFQMETLCPTSLPFWPG